MAFCPLFIKALQHNCWRSVGHQILQPTKDVKFRTVCLKSCRQKMMHQDSLEPAAIQLCSNAYRSLPGDQDIFSLLFSFIYIHRNPRNPWYILYCMKLNFSTTSTSFSEMTTDIPFILLPAWNTILYWQPLQLCKIDQRLMLIAVICTNLSAKNFLWISY